MEYSKQLSDSLHQAFMALGSLRSSLYDAVDAAHKESDTLAVNSLLNAADHLRSIEKTINHYTHEMTDALLKELA